jgi:hypothetical protein
VLPRISDFDDNRDAAELAMLWGWYEAANLYNRCVESFEKK